MMIIVVLLICSAIALDVSHDCQTLATTCSLKVCYMKAVALQDNSYITLTLSEGFADQSTLNCDTNAYTFEVVTCQAAARSITAKGKNFLSPACWLLTVAPPLTNTTVTYTFTVFGPTNSQIETSTSSFPIPFVQYTGHTLTLGSAQTYRSTTLLVALTIPFALPLNSALRLSFPALAADYSYIIDTVACDTPCVKLSDQVLEIEISSTTVSVTVTGIRAPLSMAKLTGIELFVCDIGAVTCYAGWSGTSIQASSACTPVDIQISSDHPYVSQSATIKIQFTPYAYYQAKSSLAVRFPYQLMSQVSNFVFGLDAQMDSSVLPIFTQNVALFTAVFPQQVATEVELTVSGITNAYTVTSAESFGLTLFDPLNNIQEQQLTGINYMVESQSIGNFVVSISNTTVSYQGTMSIAFTLQSMHTFSSLLTLTFPMQVDDFVKTTCPFTQVGFSATAECTIATNMLTITDGFSDAKFNTQDCVLHVPVTLPSTTATTADFTLLTSDQGSNINVLPGGYSFTCTPASIEIESFTSTNQITNTLSDFMLIFRLGSVPSESLVTITLPSDYSSQTLTSCTATTTTGQKPCNDYTFSVDQGGPIQVYFQQFRTQRSTKATSLSITVTVTSSGELVATGTESLTVQVTSPASLGSYSVTSDSLYMGEAATYTFQFTHTISLLPTDLIAITFPFPLDASTTCSYQCTISDSTLQITGVEISTTFAITVTTINPTSSTPLLPFLIKLNDESSSSIADYNDYKGISGTLVNRVFTFDVAMSSLKIYDHTTLTLTFQITVALPIYSATVLTYISPYLVITNSNCQSALSISCETLISQDGQSRLQMTTLAALPIGTYTVEFNGILLNVQNPITTSVEFQLATYLITGELIQSASTTKDFAFTCTKPCKSCSIQHTHCNSCLNGLLLYQYKCVTECPKGSVRTSGATCAQCQTPSMCLSCDASDTTKCNQCLDGYFLYLGYCVAEGTISVLPSTTTTSTTSIHSHTSTKTSTISTVTESFIQESTTSVSSIRITHTSSSKSDTIAFSSSTESNAQISKPSIIGNPKQTHDFDDLFPILIVIMCAMALLTIVLKIIYRSQVIVLRSFYVLISTLEQIVPLKRILEQQIILEQNSFYFIDTWSYVFLGINCLVATVCVQVHSASSLYIYFDINPTIRKEERQRGLKWKAITLLLQWKHFLRGVRDEREILVQIRPLLMNATCLSFVQVIILASYLIKYNRPKVFIYDDLAYQSMMTLLNLYHLWWIRKKINEAGLKVQPLDTPTDKGEKDDPLERVIRRPRDATTIIEQQ